MAQQGLNFIIYQEKYLKVFLPDGDVPIDNSASERAIRTFCVGKKNLNNLRPYYYFRHILTELPEECRKPRHS